jgi:hypothetical protein
MTTAVKAILVNSRCGLGTAAVNHGEDDGARVRRRDASAYATGFNPGGLDRSPRYRIFIRQYFG